ncbi:hypothetical protein MAPG_09733 [Magnaporthiopsis poae ATCC 64411]|uniref:2EXR domain-containing protein n=1 Tax=Magnaporthiopsis poae (strain ATCC 64411 / 73-15) TaxID=644358 RepID=A0A0C4EAQ6_MAGP6|nr:hypothetical protein MAPG_09733 [Magnaporthiopsis poae ATCC 64411]
MEGENEAAEGLTSSKSTSSVSSSAGSSYVTSSADSFSMNLDRPAAMDPSRDYPGFPLFLRLPVELRISVWRLFCPAMGEQRLLRFYDGEDATGEADEGFNIGWLSQQTASVRVMMSTSRGSRALGDVFFPDELEFSSTRKLLRFNRSRDVFYFNLSPSEFWKMQEDDIKEACTGIQCMAFNATHIYPVAFWHSVTPKPLIRRLPGNISSFLQILANLPDLKTVYWVSYDTSHQFSDLDRCDCSGPGCLSVGSSVETNIIRSACPPGKPDFSHRATAFVQSVLRTIHGIMLQGSVPLPLTREQWEHNNGIDKVRGMLMGSLVSVPTTAKEVDKKPFSLLTCQPIWEREQLQEVIRAAAAWEPALWAQDSEDPEGSGDSENQEDQEQAQDAESQGEGEQNEAT